MEVFNDTSSSKDLIVNYYPGMVEVYMIDKWYDREFTFNLSMAQWRALNTAIEATHSEGYV